MHSETERMNPFSYNTSSPSADGASLVEREGFKIRVIVVGTGVLDGPQSLPREGSETRIR